MGSAWASAPSASPWLTAGATTPSPGEPQPKSRRTGNHGTFDYSVALLPNIRVVLSHAVVFLCFSVRISIVKNSHVSIVINNNIQVMVLLHRVWKKHPVNVDFLGIYIPSDNQYSPLVHGLIGTSLKLSTKTHTGIIWVRKWFWQDEADFLDTTDSFDYKWNRSLTLHRFISYLTGSVEAEIVCMSPRAVFQRARGERAWHPWRSQPPEEGGHHGGEGQQAARHQVTGLSSNETDFWANPFLIKTINSCVCMYKY